MKNLPISRDDAGETEPNGQKPLVKIAFLDVGQGDTIVISSPETDEAFVIDCIDAEAVLDYLIQEKIRYLRGVIITHLHDDHCAQIDDLLNRYHLVPGMQECEKLAFVHVINKKDFDRLARDDDNHQESVSGPQGSVSKKGKRIKSSVLQGMLDWCYGDKKRYVDPSVQGAALWQLFGGTLAKCLDFKHPYSIDLFQLEPKGLNNTSVVCRVEGPDSSALLTGDLEPEGWKLLKQNEPYLRSDVLKFPHHGGKWDELSTRSLLDTVKPTVVVISVGTDGARYKHPNKAVFDTLSLSQYSHIRVLCTQATNQCRALVREKSDSVIQLLDYQCSQIGHNRIGSKRGCPCSGTVIIELGAKADVVQPRLDFHRNRIITPLFPDHKCYFP